MAEDARAPASKAAPAIKRLLAAGYVGADSCTLKLVHCGQEKFSWMANGFLQCFLDMDTAEGKVKARVLDYAPRQCLQVCIDCTGALARARVCACVCVYMCVCVRVCVLGLGLGLRVRVKGQG